MNWVDWPPIRADERVLSGRCAVVSVSWAVAGLVVPL